MKAGALVLTIPALLLGVVEAGAQERFEWNGTLRSGEVVEVKGISGDIRAVRSSGSQVEILATKHGRRSHFEDVLVKVEEMPDGIVVCAVYGVRPGRDYDCRSGRNRNRDHDWDWDEIDVSVDFEIRIPDGIEFEGTTVSGDIEVEDLDSRVTAKAVSGDIAITTDDLAEASTVSGSIDIVMGRADWDGELSFETVSGDITLTFTGELNSEVDF
ncbi:MAG: DUF4097 family beta strand repeat-containing protein, partial [Gemmatimonadota bacterium]|nr:DUF4097 family beta strand repeat-containing protein [Gemmatimonadota bacterium]